MFLNKCMSLEILGISQVKLIWQELVERLSDIAPAPQIVTPETESQYMYNSFSNH